MMNRIIITCLVFASLAIYSCKKPSQCLYLSLDTSNCATDSAVVHTGIIGKWNWVQSWNPWTSVTSNPCTDSKNYAFEFLDNGQVKYYLNGSLNGTGTWSIVQQSGWKLQAADAPITFSESGWVYLCDSKYLVVDNSPVDGMKDYFKKE